VGYPARSWFSSVYEIADIAPNLARSEAELQVTDHALDAVALAIHAPVPADFGLAIGFGRNAGTDAGLVQAGADDW
jgi:hypothetical protein